MIHASCIKLGGNQVTNDLAKFLNIPFYVAENIKQNISLDEYQKRWNLQMGKLMKYSKRGIQWGGLMFRSPDLLVNSAFNTLTKPIIWRAITCRPMFGIY